MKSTKKLIAWFDDHIMELVAGFLLAFIPLYPKWPLFDALPGYIVRIRLDDFMIGLAVLIFLIQLARKKVSLKKNPLVIPIVIYWIIGLLSSLSAIFITHTVPTEPIHMGKLFLHWIRRIEYMSLGIIFFSAYRGRDSIKRIFTIFILTTAILGLYGLGQKYLSWPVYSTMNREFSKGWRLVLTENARVSSTFAGHYDFAAFTVLALSALASLIILIKGKLRPLLAVLYILTFAMLLLTASRTGFIAYLVAITLVCGLVVKLIGYKKAAGYWLVLMLVSGIGIRSFGTLYSRFAHILMLDRFEGYITSVTDKLKPERDKNIEISRDLALVYTPTDTPPSPANKPTPDPNLPPDVYEDIPESFPEASLSAIPETSGTGAEGKPRTYSDSAYRFGLSSAIRFDALWPKALAGFRTNPLLGSGYSTLLKDQVTDFTEAESTDNDYLRALGETGLLGLISYYGIIAGVLYFAYKKLLKTRDQLTRSYLVFFMAGTFGLLVYALYIDIFEASKIAYLTWGLLGFTSALIVGKPKTSKKKSSK